MPGPTREPPESQPIAHRHVSVLKVADPKVLDEVRAIVPLDQFVIGVVSETELVIDPSRVGQLASALAERGLAPLMKRARAAGKDHGVAPKAPLPVELDEEPTQAMVRRREIED